MLTTAHTHWRPHKAPHRPQITSLYYFHLPSCLLCQGLVCHNSWYFLSQGLREGSSQFFLLWEFRGGFLDTMHWFLTSFSRERFGSRVPFYCSDQVLAMLTISRWHKHLWLPTSAVMCRMVESTFPKPNSIFQPLWWSQATRYLH